MGETVQLTVAQATVRFLSQQYSESDGVEHKFFEGCFGIFGHGNVAGIGQALHQSGGPVRYYQCRNEQAMVHTAAAFAKATNRLTEITQEINSSVEEQASGAQAVVRAMERMRELVQQSTSSSTELAAAAEQMSKLSRQLLESIDRKSVV